MSNDSTSKNSVSYLSTDSSQEIDINNNQQQRSDMFSKTNSTNSGYLTRSKKSGLVFSVSRIENHLRKGRYAPRINSQASIYLASVIEYLVAETLELAGDMTHKGKRKRITPRDISLAIKNDHELAKLCSDVTIPEGGVQPFIHQVLLKPTQRPRKRRVRFSEDDVNTTYKPLAKKNNANTHGYSASYLSDVDDSDLQME